MERLSERAARQTGAQADGAGEQHRRVRHAQPAAWCAPRRAGGAPGSPRSSVPGSQAGQLRRASHEILALLIQRKMSLPTKYSMRIS